METTDRVSLDRSDFIGFDWVFDMQGSLERLLDRIDREERMCASEATALEDVQ